MDPFKIRNFERENGPGTFFRCRHVPETEALEVLNRLRSRLHLSAQVDALNVLKSIRDRSTRLEGLNAADEGFDIQPVLSKLRATDRVFLNWRQFDDLNEVRVDDLQKNFEYLWYPSSDDLEILDPELGWILSIDHSGSILLLDLS